jgi:hypothetical protein
MVRGRQINVGNLLDPVWGTGRTAVVSTETFLEYTPIDTIFTADASRVEAGLRLALEEGPELGPSIPPPNAQEDAAERILPYKICVNPVYQFFYRNNQRLRY